MAKVLHREIHVDVISDDGATLRTRVWLKDIVHDIDAFLTFDIGARVLRDVRAEIRRSPFPTCPRMHAILEGVRDVPIDQTAYKRLAGVLGVGRGCPRVLELMMIGVSHAALYIINPADDLAIDLARPEVAGFCVATMPGLPERPPAAALKVV